MDRLTRKCVDGMAYVPIDAVSRLNEECVELPITKLAEYEDLEEQELLVRLPSRWEIPCTSRDQTEGLYLNMLSHKEAEQKLKEKEE